MFGVHYPNWLNAIGWTLTWVSVAALAIFLTVRAREIIGGRPRKQRL
jgi:hypothetical protein